MIATIEAGVDYQQQPPRFAVNIFDGSELAASLAGRGEPPGSLIGGATNTRIKDEDATSLLALVAAQDDLTLRADAGPAA